MSILHPCFALNVDIKNLQSCTCFHPEEHLMDKDQKRINGIARGDRNALIELIADWKGPIHSYFYRSLSNYADAEDLTQQFFHRIYKASGSYRPISKVSTWLFSIARNLLIDELKKKARRPQANILSEWELGTESSENTSELQEILSIEMKKLPENHKTALLLRVQQEWSYQEIAEMMKTNESRVKTLIYRARSVLKQAIKPQL